MREYTKSSLSKVKWIYAAMLMLRSTFIAFGDVARVYRS